ncbi:MAG: hypothetical protein WC596_00685 [Candidatus Shapirobacteria bacterium]
MVNQENPNEFSAPPMRDVPIEEVESTPILWLSALVLRGCLAVARQVNLRTGKVIEALNKKESDVVAGIERRGV